MKKSKNLFRSVFCFFVIFVFVFSLGTSVQAEGKEKSDEALTMSINEYDIYVDSREKSSVALAEDGWTKEEIAELKSDVIETELLKRAKLSAEVLENDYGYSEEQVAILKRYDGSAIEENPQLRAVLGKVTCSFAKVLATTTAMTIKASWSWSNAPLLSNPDTTDIVALRWEGTNGNGTSMNLRHEYSKVSVQHYSRSGSFVKGYSPSVKINDQYRGVSSKIQMSYGSDAHGWIWAKKGSITTKVVSVGKGKIEECQFLFAYGKAKMSVSPSVSFPKSAGVSFSLNVAQICSKTVVLTNKGKLIY